MARPGSIVVGTDGSQRAERAVDRAGELASALGVTVHIVSGYSRGSSGVRVGAAVQGQAAVERQVDDEKRVRAQHHVDRAQQRLAQVGVVSETHVWPEEPAEALVGIADEQGAQMIIVGNRGMTGARRVLGSVPNRVSHTAHCDVLIVPTDQDSPTS
jgi:nucleotide-binding universal stress UspA family protein